MCRLLQTKSRNTLKPLEKSRGFLLSKQMTQSRVIVEYSGMDMDEQKRYMNLSLDAPRSVPSEYKTRDELLASMDEYIRECESQEGLCRLAKYEHESNTEVSK